MKESCLVKETCKKYNENTCDFDDDICIRQHKLEYLLGEAGLYDSQKRPFQLYIDQDGSDLEAYSRLKEISKDIVNFVDEGKNLYIYSSTPGNGKTSWSIKLIQSYLTKIWPNAPMTSKALFIHVPTFLLELKRNISRHSDYIDFVEERVFDVDLVVWDDIATKSASEFEHEHLLSLIDRRMFANQTNIFTSNIPPNSLSSSLGDRLGSRIVNKSELIEFVGKDKRGVNK